MNEWTVVTVVIGLVGAFFVIYNPISKSTKENTAAMTSLNITIQQLARELKETKADNKDSHKRMHERNDRQDDLIKKHEIELGNHEGRLQKLEKDN